MYRKGLYILLACCCPVGSTAAQDPGGDPATLLFRDINPQNADRFELDLSIPTSPAFTVIGVTPENVVDPGNARDFAVEVASFINEDGGVDPGLAISFKPYWLGLREITLGEYADVSQLERVLARTQLSLATAESPVGDGDDARAGIGVHTSLLDETDPRLDPALGNCIDEAYRQHVASRTRAVLIQANEATEQRIGDRDVGEEEADRILIEEFNKLRPTIDLSAFNAAYDRCQDAAAVKS